MRLLLFFLFRFCCSENMESVKFSKGEMYYVTEGFEMNIREDGRSRDCFRPVLIRTNVTESANGSALVQIGEMSVTASVWLDFATPLETAPDQGFIEFKSRFFISDESEEEISNDVKEAENISRIFKQAYYSQSAFDRKQLCLVAGHLCWNLKIDLSIMGKGGNLFDVASIAVKMALHNTVIPQVEASCPKNDTRTINIENDINKGYSLNISNVPMLVTIGICGTMHIIDMNQKESECMNKVMVVGISGNELECARVTYIGSLKRGALMNSSFLKVIATAVHTGAHINRIIESIRVKKKFEENSEFLDIIKQINYEEAVEEDLQEC
ncbi:Exosome complex component RRP42 [Trichinella pseudospiralis]|uniref:Ribosomal RNA-processing protein 42 n=1 Tax=Trichinella pseudospiralis TaxID=6337 RepID=A0A0V1F6Y7_TRIPS|nr:Exosome complex component RRP42 [Trichinella pseudospiralis]